MLCNSRAALESGIRGLCFFALYRAKLVDINFCYIVLELRDDRTHYIESFAIVASSQKYIRHIGFARRITVQFIYGDAFFEDVAYFHDRKSGFFTSRKTML